MAGGVAGYPIRDFQTSRESGNETDHLLDRHEKSVRIRGLSQDLVDGPSLKKLRTCEKGSGRRDA